MQLVDSDSEEDVWVEPVVKTPVSTFIPERDQNGSAAAPGDDVGNESDDSVKVMEPSNPVIHIDESDNEEAVSDVPTQQEPPQKSVSVEFSSTCTQTSQKSEVER